MLCYPAIQLYTNGIPLSSLSQILSVTNVHKFDAQLSEMAIRNEYINAINNGFDPNDEFPAYCVTRRHLDTIFILVMEYIGKFCE